MYAISAYHHYHCEFEPRSGEVYSIQHYVIKFVSDLRQVGGFLLHDITEILLEVALNTHKPTIHFFHDIYKVSRQLECTEEHFLDFHFPCIRCFSDSCWPFDWKYFHWDSKNVFYHKRNFVLDVELSRNLGRMLNINNHLSFIITW